MTATTDYNETHTIVNSPDIDWATNDILKGIVMTFVVCLQVFIPIILCIIGCRRKTPDGQSNIAKYKTFQKQMRNDLEKMSSAAYDKTNVNAFDIQRTASLYLYASFWMWTVYIIVISIIHIPDGLTVFGLLYHMSWGTLPLFYLCILLECSVSPELKYINNMMDIGMVKELIEAMRSSRPIIQLHVRCYHYQQVSDDREIVDTVNFTKECKYRFWVNESDNSLENLRKMGITRIQIGYIFLLGDDAIRGKFAEQYCAFYDTYKNRDEYFQIQTLRQVAEKTELQTHLAVFCDPKSKSWWIKKRYYWLASVFGLTWPYRLLFNSTTGKTRYNIIKKMFISRPTDGVLNNENATGSTTFSNAGFNNAADGVTQIQVVDPSPMQLDQDLSDAKHFKLYLRNLNQIFENRELDSVPSFRMGSMTY